MAEGAPAIDPFLGRNLADKYVVESFIGGGSMGAVYRARQLALQRVVAIKVMYPELATDREFAARFRREAHAASRLAHTNSITITDFGEEPDGLLYLVMEYVAGPSLEDLLERGESLPEERVVDIMSQILSALAAAHDAGIVHRDLKPANVLVIQKFDDDGYPIDHVKVCDFGVASLRDVAAEGVIRPSQDGMGAVSPEHAQEARRTGLRPMPKALTLAGAVVGTPAYMSPEQASGKPQDARSDLYSLGVVLFELLTRRLPFDGATAEELMARHIVATPPSPATLVACHPKLAEACLRALQKNPAARFPNARAMRAELRSVHQLPSLGDVPTLSSPSVDPRSSSASGTIRLGTSSASMPVARRDLLPRETVAENVPASMRVAGQEAHDGISTMGRDRSARPKWPYALGVLLVAGSAIAYAVRREPVVVVAAALPASSELRTEPAPATSATVDVAPTSSMAPGESAAPVAAVAPKNLPAMPGSRTSRPAASAPERAAVTPLVAPEPAKPSPITPAPILPEPAKPSPITPSPAAPAFVPDHARVRIAVASVSRIQRTPVLSVVQRIDVNDCYRATLRALGRAEGGAGSVSLDIDEDGVIAVAAPKLPGPLGAAGGCIAGKIRGQRLAAPPDTGSAGAVLSLTFEP